MPRLQDIERFKRDLAGLSHEAEVLERWGEKPEAITPPEGAAAAPSPAAKEGAPGPSKTGPRETARKEPVEDEGLPPDFASLLDNLPLDQEPDTEAASVDDELSALLGPSSEEETGAQQEGSLADLDFGLGFKDEAPPAAESSEPLESLEALESIAESPDSEEVPAPEERPEADSFDFSMPEFDEGASLGEEPREAGVEGEETIEGFPTEPSGEASFETSAEARTGAESGGEDLLELEGEEGPEPSPAGAAPAEDFSIPEFDLVEEQETAPGPVAEEGASPAMEEGFGAGAGEADAFETFSFEEPGAPADLGGSSFGLPPAGFESGGGRDLDTEIASLSEEASVADTFKIDQDWGGFSMPGAEAPKQAAPRPTRAKAAAAAAPEETFKPVSLSEAQVDRLQDSLLAFPLNLRVAVEDILANGKGSEAQQSKLVWALVDGVAAEDVAILAGRILKRHIAVPKGHEKRTGAAFEAQKGSFAYAFTHTFLPIIKVGIFVLAAASALGYLGWRFIYVPLASDSLYRAGYQRIAEDRYPEAEADFDKATSMREFIAWYYRYAAAYTAKRQYILAEKKYASLIEAHPKEIKGILAWARLEKDQLKFEEGVTVLKGAPPGAKGEAARGKTGLLSWDYFNEEGLLLLGDTFLDWAEENPAKYEEARRTYATLLEHYGDKDLYLERMLLYFIRIDKLKEVLPLKAHFLADPKSNTLGAEVLSELGGYLLDKGMREDVREILVSASKKDPSEPEAHYHLARYFRLAGDAGQERQALDNSVQAFAALPGLGGRRAGMYIDSLIWRARFLVEAKVMARGPSTITRPQPPNTKRPSSSGACRRAARFGAAYAGLADVAYTGSATTWPPPWPSTRGRRPTAIRRRTRITAEGTSSTGTDATPKPSSASTNRGSMAP